MLNSIAKSAVVTTALFGLLFIAKDASAQTIGPRVENRCDRVLTRLNNTISRIEKYDDRVQSAFQKAAERLKERGDRLEASNPTAYETLKGYYETLTGTYLSKINTDFETYRTDLGSAQSAAQSGQCGTSDGAYKQAITKAKADHQQVKSDVAAAKSYYLDTIKPYIISLRQGALTPTPAL